MGRSFTIEADNAKVVGEAIDDCGTNHSTAARDNDDVIMPVHQDLLKSGYRAALLYRPVFMGMKKTAAKIKNGTTKAD